MAKILDKQRYKCALASMQTVQAITRAIPVLHSGPGCAQKLSDTTGSSGQFSPNIFPLTRIKDNWVAEFIDSEGNHIEVTAPVRQVSADAVTPQSGKCPKRLSDIC